MPRAVPLPTITDDSALGGAVIEKSLRFNDDDGAFLSRTPSSAGNRKTWTWSAWIKRANIGSRQILFSADDNATHATYFILELQSDDNLRCLAGQETASATCVKETTMVIRDTTNWYHLVFKFDATNASAVWYVNGQEITTLNSSTNPSNQDFQVNATSQHFLGRFGSSLGTSYFDGYMAEVNFIDGQALGPEYFGFTEFQTGAWKPRGYYGSYGTNGFRLDFSDNSSTAALGIDKSPNGNDFTTNNFSVSAGVGNDSLEDTPTNNFCTLNSISLGQGNEQNTTFSNGNLDFTDSSSSNRAAVSTFGLKTGKWYYELTCTNSGVYSIGWYDMPNNGGSFYRNNGSYSSAFAAGGQFGYSTWTTNDVIGVAIDFDSGKIWYAKNNTWQSGDPATGNSPTNTFTTGKTLFVEVFTDNVSGTKSGSLNFGQRAFIYTPPTGYKALSSRNLPKPTTPIINPDQHFKALLYTGTGSSNIVEGLNFTPDMVWVKGRDTNGYEHMIIDTVRGGTKSVVPNASDSESTHGGRSMTFYNRGVRWNSDSGNCNANGENYVLWCWKAGGAAVSNSDGSITSSVSANQQAGFSIVSYTGTGSVATIGHGLGKKPDWIIVKNRTDSNNWNIYHSANGANYVLYFTTSTRVDQTSNWNDTEPTSTVFTVGTSNGTNGSSDNMIAYCWSEIPGFSRFGSYVGNGNAEGPFVYCGFRPAFVLTKMIDTMNENWTINDSSRSTYNPVDLFLRPDEAVMDTSGAATMDFCAEGFKLRNTDDKTNRDGGTFIFTAFAEQSPVTPYDEFTNAR